MMMKRLLTATSFAIAIAGQSLADSPGALSAGGYVQEYNSYGTVEDHAIYGPGAAQIGAASIQVEALPGGAILARTPTQLPYHNAFIAAGSLTYYAELVGPAETGIPVRFYFDIAASNTGVNSSDSAGVVFGNTFYDIDTRNGQAPVSANGYLIGYEATNSPIKIELGASSQNGGFAYADPFLEIDPNWAAANPTEANQLSLSFSDGIDNALGNLAVPEPASWALMLVGFGLAGAVMRRRHRHPTLFGD